MPLTLSMKSNAYNVTECPYYGTLSVDLELNNTIKKYRENNNKKLLEKKKTLKKNFFCVCKKQTQEAHIFTLWIWASVTLKMHCIRKMQNWSREVSQEHSSHIIWKRYWNECNITLRADITSLLKSLLSSARLFTPIFHTPPSHYCHVTLSNSCPMPRIWQQSCQSALSSRVKALLYLTTSFTWGPFLGTFTQPVDRVIRKDFTCCDGGPENTQNNCCVVERRCSLAMHKKI